MSSRKPHNHKARIERACRSLLRSNHVAVVNIDPSGLQCMINTRSAKRIPASVALANAVCDYPHRWRIYLAALCIEHSGTRYIKAVEVAPNGIYRAEQLDDVIEAYYRDLLSTCNSRQVVGSGWIASPCDESLTEEQADRVFDAVGAWRQQVAA